MTEMALSVEVAKYQIWQNLHADSNICRFNNSMIAFITLSPYLYKAISPYLQLHLKQL